MRREVSATIAFTTAAGATQVVIQAAVARVPGLTITDELTLTLDGGALPVTEVPAAHHGVLHVAHLGPGTVRGGAVQIAYRAVVDGVPSTAPSATAAWGLDQVTYLRPSRYAESDRLLPTARRRFASLRGLDLVNAVADWVNGHLVYVPGSSRYTDGAVETLLHGQGVCRDYAHLVVALLRGLDVPARIAAVYAPGLQPMDFHAVAEAWVDGAWHVVDATRLAPREAMLRVATGRDAADIAFLSRYGAGLTMGPQSVTAIAHGALPVEDARRAVHLA